MSGCFYFLAIVNNVVIEHRGTYIFTDKCFYILTFYLEREKKLAVELSTLIEEKCKLLEKFSLVQKEVRHF